MESLKEYTRQKIKNLFNTLKMETNSPSFLLVTDDVSLKILASLIKMNEIVDYGICAIEKLSLKRKKFKKIQSIYLIHDNKESVDALLKDYSETNIQYELVHIFFTSRISDDSLERISSCEQLLKRIKSFKQLNIEFMCNTDRDFTTDIMHRGDSMSNLYVDAGIAYEEEEQLAIDRLGSVILSMDKFHGVEILYTKNEKQKLPAEGIAKGLESKLNKAFKLYEKVPHDAYDFKANKITVVIMDRSYDPISPLMHDFHYAPLLVENGLVTDNFKSNLQEKEESQKKNKSLLLNEQDPIYMKYRYRHIAKVFQELLDDLKYFSENDEAAKFEKQQSANLNNMGGIMKKITEYNETKQRYSLHIKMLESLQKRFKDLKRLADLEQTITTGKDEDNKEVEDKKIMVNVSNYLKEEKNKDNKIKILLLAAMCLSLKQRPQVCARIAELDSRLSNANVNAALAYLRSKVPKKLLVRSETEKLILNRNYPRIEELLQSLLVRKNKTDLLSIKINLSGKVSTTGSANTGRKKIGKQENSKDLQKLIVYIPGGISYHEIRCINRFSDNYIVICGGNQIISTQKYLEQIINLSTIKKEEEL